MNTYTIRFHGRTKNAIGICYYITATVQADTEGLAILKLYDEYEHIQVETINGKEVIK